MHNHYKSRLRLLFDIKIVQHSTILRVDDRRKDERTVKFWSEICDWELAHKPFTGEGSQAEQTLREEIMSSFTERIDAPHYDLSGFQLLDCKVYLAVLN